VTSEEQAQRILQLEQKNAKLEKINQVLISRVEQGGGNQSDPYSAFEHSVQLAQQVRDKTKALNETLEALERSNLQLTNANNQANIFRQRFIDAIESMSDAFVLLDSAGRIILQNSNFTNFWNNSNLAVEQGINFKDFKELAKNRGIISQAYPGVDQNSPTYQLSDGRWFQLNQRRTHEGGWVMLYSDITAVKAAATQRFELAMTQKSRLLQNLIDNLAQGVVLLSSNHQIEVWNRQFSQMSQLSQELLQSGPALAKLQSLTQLDLTPNNIKAPSFKLQVLSTGTVLEVREHTLINGQLIKTFTDVTERRNSALALQQAHDELEKRVEQRTGQLQLVNNKLLNEIDERRLAQADLVNAKREAELANRSKSKFLAAVSHDLLQPLNAAQLFLGSMADIEVKPELGPLLAGVSNSLIDLENLIVGLVDISKLDAGIVIADPQSFSLSLLLDNMALEYQQLSPKYNIDFKYVSSNVVVNTDSALLARILRNLLSNAFRYGCQGKVLLGVRRKASCLTIEVWDNGLGIADDQLADIFVEFKRLEGANKAFSNGLGLGLAIVDKLSKVLNHPIKVRSTVGKGSVFSIDVPLGLPMINTTDNRQAIAMTLDSLHKTKVWLVDNDQQICDAMAILLTKWGCEVITALTEQGLAEQVDIKAAAVDLLIVDYHLDHQITGFSLASSINQQRLITVPVLMITANYSQQLQAQMKENNIVLLNKPIKPMKLKTTMLHLLN